MEKTEISLNEYRVLEFIKDRKDVPEDSINMDSDRRIVSSAVSYLEFKNLIDTKKVYYDYFTVTEEGEKYIENGFPEEKLYKLLEERKKCSMDEIKNYLKEDYRIAIANLAKLGIKPSNGEMSYSGENLITIFNEKRNELSEIMEGKTPDGEALDEFIHRGLVSKRKYAKRIINIKKEGIIAVENYGSGNYIELLTPALIASGKWKEMKFRPYDLNSRVEPLNGAGLHPLTYLIEKVRKIFLEMGFTGK